EHDESTEQEWSEEIEVISSLSSPEGVHGGERRSVYRFDLVSFSLSRNLSIFVSEKAILSLSATNRRISLSSWLLEETIRLLRWLSSRRKSLTISLSVCFVDGKGLLSLCMWIYWNRKVRIFFAVALVDGAFSR
ncbi:unnamed protein product, partial [Brassica oleracea]